MMHLKNSISKYITRIKQLQGDPHYIAMGMGIGIFVCATPTFPFQTVLAVALAFILRGSKAAAAIGSGVGIPVIPFFYLASYKIGKLILGHSSPFENKIESILELFKMGMDVSVAMITGGVIVGILPGIVAYLITHKIFTTLLSRKNINKKTTGIQP